MLKAKIAAMVLPLYLVACASSSGPPQGPMEKSGSKARPENMSGPISATRTAGLLIASFNRNDDYSISQEEYQNGVAQAFTIADNNGDLKLDPFEIQHWRENALGSQDVAPSTMYFDTDFNQIITKEEFRTAFSKIFKRLEVNGDGAIGFNELMRVVAPPRANSGGAPRRNQGRGGPSGGRGGQGGPGGGGARP
ncbi:MAG: hypothetical protein COA43_05375 [Robiginitomaculum sp.]|nr:MAG: hypothetical protein COA43_05375 [Robiginitomaculum sp.]